MTVELILRTGELTATDVRLYQPGMTGMTYGETLTDTAGAVDTVTVAVTRRALADGASSTTGAANATVRHAGTGTGPSVTAGTAGALILTRLADATGSASTAGTAGALILIIAANATGSASSSGTATPYRLFAPVPLDYTPPLPAPLEYAGLVVTLELAGSGPTPVDYHPVTVELTYPNPDPAPVEYARTRLTLTLTAPEVPVEVAAIAHAMTLTSPEVPLELHALEYALAVT